MTDLTGRCGSCANTLPTGSPYKFYCKLKRSYVYHGLQVKQRTMKACRKYVPKEVSDAEQTF